MPSAPIQLPLYSLGVGDRFARQATPQLAACMQALQQGVLVAPVWNKSDREHTLLHTSPAQTRQAADEAVHALAWQGAYFCDADHIRATTVDRYLAPCDFFTLDVADRIGTPAPPAAIDAFLARHPELPGTHHLPGLAQPVVITPSLLQQTAHTYLAAVESAAEFYRLIAARKGAGQFITEISMDETATAQTPAELLILLAAIADRGIPIQTIAPKFTGSFHKGVDYQGNLDQFATEFAADIAVLTHAAQRYGLPPQLKLSVHSGSDKFSLYPSMRRALLASGAGLHIKTAGTTWLEELIGLAQSGGAALAFVKELYAQAHAQREALCAPYATVTSIDPAQLPAPEAVQTWSAEQFTSALRHDPHCPAYNPNLRQLLHVSFKLAGAMGTRYLDLLREHRDTIAANVTANLYQRHIYPLFVAPPQPENPA